MSDENNSCCPSPEAEPTATRSAVPMWIIVAALTLVFLGGVYFDTYGGWFDARVYPPYTSAEKLESFQPKSGDAAMLAMGKARYEAVCAICHGSDGLGKPGMAPTLAGSEWVVSTSPKRVAEVVQRGLVGPIKVAGKDWNMAMAAMGASMSDDELAAVLTYIRTSWGNKASAVTPEDVKAIRAEIGQGAPAINEAELLKIAE